MGKNKWYTEFDGGVNPSYRPAGASKSKKTNNLPGLFVDRNPGAPTLGMFFSALARHLKRHWLPVKFLFSRLSLSVLKCQTLLKIGFLVGIGYYAMSERSTSASFISGAQSDIEWGNETNLAVAAEKPKTAPKKEKSKPKNDAAPVNVESIKGDRSAAFIQKYSGVARQEMAKYGIPASISLAQGLIESRAGTSKLAVQNNNHFGMKCFSRNCRKGHCSNHTDDTHKDFFLKFSDPKLSWRAHSILLASGRYAKLKKYGKDYKRWAYGLKSVGYATDKTYAEKLIRTIERYDLHQFDR